MKQPDPKPATFRISPRTVYPGYGEGTTVATRMINGRQFTFGKWVTSGEIEFVASTTISELTAYGTRRSRQIICHRWIVPNPGASK